MKPIDVICALNDVDDEYILHAMSPNRRKVVSIRRVLIAAIIVILAVVCATSIYSSKTFRYGIKTATDDPVDSALNYLESLADEDYVSTIEVYGGMIYDQRTAEVLEYWDNVASERDWNEDNFVVVYTEYYVEYVHDMVPLNDGYTARTFWMEYDEVTNAWYYYDGMSGIPFLGIFEEDGLGHDGWTKDDVAAYNAATAYLEENFAEVEICGYKLDDSKALEVIGDYSELAEERGWRWTQWTTYDYTFLVVYAEYYADYEYSAVWLWMEKDAETGEWSCYKADTEVELEYVYVTREAPPGQDERALEAATQAIKALAEDESIESVCMYGSKVDRDQTRLVLIDDSNPLAEKRGWSRVYKTFYVIYAEYQIRYTNGGADDVIAYLWMERDTETDEWSCYSIKDITATKSRFLYKPI
ncbi:MAG: hypothetical protein LUH56_06435 [Oscillospiraceae bacterium]|nr:hypothetical protein [Oscillospiraceae bacterium]